MLKDKQLFKYQENGGTVVGNKGAASGYPAGTKIPPTKVDIIRPKDIKTP